MFRAILTGGTCGVVCGEFSDDVGVVCGFIHDGGLCGVPIRGWLGVVGLGLGVKGCRLGYCCFGYVGGASSMMFMASERKSGELWNPCEHRVRE